MCAFTIYPCPGVTHYPDRLTARDPFASLHCDRAEMSVQTVIARAIPPMLDYNVFAVVGVVRHETNVYDLAICNGAYFVERLAIWIAVHRLDINPFVKAHVNDAASSAFRIADKPVLAALPWRRFHAVVISIDILIKRGAISRKQGIIVCG